MLAWVNGKPADHISVYDRGLAYGDGFFETILVKDNKPSLLNYHLERMAEAASAFAIPLDSDQVKEELARFCQLNSVPRAVVKVVISRGRGGRGYSPAAQPNPIRILSLHPSPQSEWQDNKLAIRVGISSVALSAQPRLAGLKHLNRLEQVLAKQEVDQQNQWDDALVLDEKKHLIEATSANLFLIKGGEVFTPKLECCGVKGCVRRLLLDRLESDLNIKIYEKKLKLSELKSADEIFLTNSVAGVIPVKQVGLWQFQQRQNTNKIGCWVESQL